MLSNNFLLSEFLPNFKEIKSKVTLNSHNIPYCTNSLDQDFTNHQEKTGVLMIDKDQKKEEALHFFDFEDSEDTKQKKKAELIKKEVKLKKKDDKEKEIKEAEKIAYNIAMKKQTFEATNDYALISEFNKQNLDKFRLDNEEAKFGSCENYGSLYYFNNDYNKISPLNPQQLKTFKDTKFSSGVPTYKDSNLTDIEGFNMYISDKVLSVLMTMNMNSRPWHINIKKEKGKLFFDIDDDSDLTYVSVNESDCSPLDNDPIEMNNYLNLSKEATIINNYLSETVLGDRIESDLTSNYNNSPFAEGDEEKDKDLERALYSYREWKIGEDLRVLVRCTIHCGDLTVYDEDEEDLLKYNVFALNEYNVRIYF